MTIEIMDHLPKQEDSGDHKITYVKPAYESETIFETAAISCNKRYGNCQVSAQDS